MKTLFLICFTSLIMAEVLLGAKKEEPKTEEVVIVELGRSSRLSIEPKKKSRTKKTSKTESPQLAAFRQSFVNIVSELIGFDKSRSDVANSKKYKVEIGNLPYDLERPDYADFENMKKFEFAIIKYDAINLHKSLSRNANATDDYRQILKYIFEENQERVPFLKEIFAKKTIFRETKDLNISPFANTLKKQKILLNNSMTFAPESITEPIFIHNYLRLVAEPGKVNKAALLANLNRVVCFPAEPGAKKHLIEVIFWLINTP